jgi:AbrB family looped-hinge helix DNA binding protein
MQTEKDKYIFGVVKVGDKGQIVIPKEAREVFGIESGDSLLVLGDRTKGLAIVKTQIFDSALEEVFK